jgi:hypothetical protein
LQPRARRFHRCGRRGCRGGTAARELNRLHVPYSERLNAVSHFHADLARAAAQVCPAHHPSAAKRERVGEANAGDREYQ